MLSLLCIGSCSRAVESHIPARNKRFINAELLFVSLVGIISSNTAAEASKIIMLDTMGVIRFTCDLWYLTKSFISTNLNRG